MLSQNEKTTELTQEYLTDTLKLAPLNSECYIQSPHEEILSVLYTMNPKTDKFHTIITLTDEYKKKLFQAILDKHIEGFIQSMEIRVEGKLFFEGYDGMEYGTFSKFIELPIWFVEKYITNDMGIISDEW